MPSIHDNVMPTPEFQGKEQYVKGDKNTVNSIKSMFLDQAKYKIVILKPGSYISHAPTFFQNPEVPQEGVLGVYEFESGVDAYSKSRSLIDDTIKSHTEANGFTGGFKVNAIILSKDSNSNSAMVKGFIEADVNASSTNYYIANNPNPSVLKYVSNENIM